MRKFITELLAGSSWKEILAVYAAIFVAVAIFHIAKAHAQDARDPAPHEMYHDFYKEWMQPPPNQNLSCCNANEYADDDKMIHINGDCEPTDAELRPTGEPRKGPKTPTLQWWAKLPKYLGSEWIPIPDAKIIRERNPDPNRGHLCYSYGRVLCFVPPFGGM